jgi:RNA polymerase sigma-70 factor (ECF subfamily)
MTEQDDAAVVRSCLQGDVDSFGVLVGRYERVVYNLALRMLGNGEDARDATQTAFMRAYESLARFDPRRRFFSWIYRITMNECLNQIERRRRFEPVACDIPSSDDPGQRVEARETGEQIDRALRALTREHREVVVLRHFLEMPYGEISDVLQVPEKTVKSRLYEARQRLCAMLPRSVA